MHGWNEKCIQHFSSVTSREDIGTEEKITLKCILYELGMKVWNELNWTRTGSNGLLFERGDKSLGSTEHVFHARLSSDQRFKHDPGAME
jgi:hypothetical protein